MREAPLPPGNEDGLACLILVAAVLALWSGHRWRAFVARLAVKRRRPVAAAATAADAEVARVSDTPDNMARRSALQRQAVKARREVEAYDAAQRRRPWAARAAPVLLGHLIPWLLLPPLVGLYGDLEIAPLPSVLGLEPWGVPRYLGPGAWFVASHFAGRCRMASPADEPTGPATLWVCPEDGVAVLGLPPGTHVHRSVLDLLDLGGKPASAAQLHASLSRARAARATLTAAKDKVPAALLELRHEATEPAPAAALPLALEGLVAAGIRAGTFAAPGGFAVKVDPRDPSASPSRPASPDGRPTVQEALELAKRPRAILAAALAEAAADEETIGDDGPAAPWLVSLIRSDEGGDAVGDAALLQDRCEWEHDVLTDETDFMLGDRPRAEPTPQSDPARHWQWLSAVATVADDAFVKVFPPSATEGRPCKTLLDAPALFLIPKALRWDIRDSAVPPWHPHTPPPTPRRPKAILHRGPRAWRKHTSGGARPSVGGRLSESGAAGGKGDRTPSPRALDGAAAQAPPSPRDSSPALRSSATTSPRRHDSSTSPPRSGRRVASDGGDDTGGSEADCHAADALGGTSPCLDFLGHCNSDGEPSGSGSPRDARQRRNAPPAQSSEGVALRTSKAMGRVETKRFHWADYVRRLPDVHMKPGAFPFHPSSLTQRLHALAAQAVSDRIAAQEQRALRMAELPAHLLDRAALRCLSAPGDVSTDSPTPHDLSASPGARRHSRDVSHPRPRPSLLTPHPDTRPDAALTPELLPDHPVSREATAAGRRDGPCSRAFLPRPSSRVLRPSGATTDAEVAASVRRTPHGHDQDVGLAPPTIPPRSRTPGARSSRGSRRANRPTPGGPLAPLLSRPAPRPSARAASPFGRTAEIVEAQRQALRAMRTRPSR